jgi:DNA-binding MarR family transcriptional regulator
VAHRIKIMPESAQARAIREQEEQHQAVLEEASAAMIRTMPRTFKNLKHQLRHSEGVNPHRDLGEQQVWTLHALGRQPQLTNELARMFNVTEPTITRIVDALVKRGYVDRLPDEKDRRKIYLRLTAAGREVSELAKEQFRAALTSFLSPLDDDQLRDIIVACGHLGSLHRPDAHDMYAYEALCPVRTSEAQAMNLNPLASVQQDVTGAKDAPVLQGT